MKVRKKPVVVEARRLEPVGTAEAAQQRDSIVQWITSEGGSARQDGFDILIRTKEGTMRASEGDWVIQGVKGEFYPCKNDIFWMTYEKIE